MKTDAKLIKRCIAAAVGLLVPAVAAGVLSCAGKQAPPAVDSHSHQPVTRGTRNRVWIAQADCCRGLRLALESRCRTTRLAGAQPSGCQNKRRLPRLL